MKRIIKKIHTLKDGDTKSVQSAFYVMVAIVILSVAWTIVSETCLKPDYKRPRAVSPVDAPASLSNSFNGVISSATDLVEIMAIKSGIDSLINKDSLTRADSLHLLGAFQKLEFLNRKTNPSSNEEN
ncbi:hypothetical protein [Sphingobacterium siyangense]|uniref:hypothetical protein n=1 Tax=Sphingobacterium siyangense TaxID=459529 RepID=UPI00289C9369|nr:hypothetical protein [Sphingobacterium siyangense]